MKRRLLALLLAAVMLLSLTACTTPSNDTPPTSGDTPDVTTPEGPVYVKDGTYRYLYSSEIGTMNYLKTGVTQDFAVICNFVDTLVEYDKYGVVQPCLAEDWKVSDDGLTWTLNLRQGVKWYDSSNEEYAELTADDFVFAMKYILSPENESSTVDIVCSVIKNAREFFSMELDDFSQVGVKATDKYTLEYTLSDPCPYFLSMLSYVCFMPANEDFVTASAELFGTDKDSLLYNGAYICTSWSQQEEMVWERNANYWDVDKVNIKAVHGRYNAESASLAPEMYQRGEIDEAVISIEILDDWMNNPSTKDLIRPSRPSYDAMWWFFNFDPQFDEQYEPENFRIAVNNTAFRLSIVNGIDRVKAMSCYDPYNPETYLMRTITPPAFAANDGMDFVQTGELKTISNTDPFNPDEAVKFRDTAKAELAAAGCKLPVIIPYYYNPSVANQSTVAQVLEQQLEGLLGTDYINIEVLAGPSTNYLKEVRSAGKYGLMEEGWGPDYADPQTYTDMWGTGWSYNWPEKTTNPEYLTGYTYTKDDLDSGKIDDESVVGTTQKIYNKLVDEAKAEKVDIGKRYELFAKAEAWLINQGFVIPFRFNSTGYVASKRTVFDGLYSSFGVSVHRYKGRNLLETPMSTDEYNAQNELWQQERAAALANAK